MSETNGDQRRPSAETPQVQAEVNRRLKAFLDALPDLFFIIDREGRIHDYHGADSTPLYLSPERFLGRTVAEVLPEPAAGLILDALHATLERERPQRVVYPLPYPDGERWFEASIAVQDDPRAADARLFFLARDITGQMRTEEALRESKERYRLLTEGMKDVVWTLDVEARRFIYVSPSVFQLRGFTPEEILTRPLEEAWAPEQRAELEDFTRQQVAAFLEGKLTDRDYVTFEILQPCKDGSLVPSEIVARILRNERTGRLEVHGVTRDISARRRAEEALRESEARFRNVARVSRSYVWEVDGGGIYTFVSSAVEDVLGYRPDELVGKMHFADFHPPAGREEFRKEAMAVFREGKPVTGFENPNVDKEGRLVWVSSSATPLFAADGTLRGYQGVDVDVTARKAVEDALRTSEARFAQNARQTRTFVWEVDGNGVYTYVSPVAEEVLGYRPDEIAGRLHFYDLHPAEGREAFTAATLEVVRKAGDFRDLENPMVAKDGRVVWVSTNAFPLRGPDGAVRGYWGSDMDVTERKRAEEALRQSEATYRQLYNSMRDPFAHTDLKGRLLEVNPAFQELLGYSREELLGMTFRDITPRKWHARERKIMSEQVKARGFSSVYEKEYVRKDGSAVPVELRTMLVCDAAGKPTGMSAIVRDVTERKRAEEALRQAHDELERRVRERTADLVASQLALAQSEEQFRQMADNVKDAFFLIDARTQKMLYVNPAFHRIWNRPVPKNVARWFDHFHPDDRDRIAEAFQRGMSTGIPATVTFRLLWPDGSVRWVEASGAMIRDGRGRPLRAAGVIRDVTDQRRLEAEILKISEAERQRIGRDLHDGLGQSLTAIGYLADAVRETLARAKRPEAADLHKLEHRIRETAAEAHALARGLLLADVKRGGLASALQELAFRTQELFGVPCRYAGPAALPPIDADVAGQIYRIAQEAATNAAKHGKAERIDVRLAKDRRGLLLTVQDSGRGLPARGRKGTGLGMDLMRYRADMIGATFWIESRRNRGTAVHCLLPRTAAMNQRKRTHES